jgi:CheY-like chemotaxis protein
MSADADPQSSRDKPLSVLVVDDDHSSREAAAKPFRDRGDHVRTASDGVDALAACLKAPPDVILSDVQMPRMDGWQLVRIVRSRPQLAQVPMLFLTRLRGEDERLKGYQLGVDDFVPKPSRPRGARGPRRPGRAASSALHRPGPKMLRGDLEQVSSLPSLVPRAGGRRIPSVMSDQTRGFWHRGGQPLKVEIDGPLPGGTSRSCSTRAPTEARSLRVRRFQSRMRDEVLGSLT